MSKLRKNVINVLQKTKSFANKYRKRLTRILALVLCWSLCIESLISSVQTGAVAALDTYKNQLGTQLGINSPLLRDEVTAEKFEPWELEVFAIFLSNFAVPFVDSMDSAFLSGAGYGTNGRGLEALKFGCGGDIVAGGILQNMVMFVLDECATKKVPLYSEFTLYRNGEALPKEGTVANEFMNPSHQAKLADILPVFAGFYDLGDLDATVGSWQLGADGPLATQQSGNSAFSGIDVLTHSWVFCGTSPAEISNSKINKLKPNLACLPTLYVDGGSGAALKAFDLGDGWDSQILAVCINYGQYLASILGVDTETDDMMNQMLSGMADSMLYLDACGNIVAEYNSRNIIIIPACMNKHLTKGEDDVNLLVAPIINDLCAANSMNIAAGISNQMSLLDQDIPTDNFFSRDAVTSYALLGTGLGLDTSASVNRDDDNNEIKEIKDHGLIDYGNLLLYNTSDTKLGWGVNDTINTNLGNIQKLLTTGGVDLHNNLCIGLIGSTMRIPGTNIDALFGLRDSDEIKAGMYHDSTTEASSSDDKKVDKAIKNAIMDRWGNGTNTTAGSGANYSDGLTGASIAAQLLQTWGVNVENHIDEINNQYNLDLSEEDKDGHEIVNTKKAAYVSNVLIGDAAEQWALFKLVRSHKNVFYTVGGGLMGFGALAVAGSIIATGIAAGGFAGAGAVGAAAALALASNPVGWAVAGAALVVGGIVCVITFIKTDEDILPFMNKAAFCINAQNMHGMVNGINTDSTPVTYKTSTSSINSAASVADIGTELGNTKSEAFAAAVANGQLSGYRVKKASDINYVYNQIKAGDGKSLAGQDKLENDIFNEISDGWNGRLASSVSVVALANDGLVEAKQYLCMQNSNAFDRLASWMYVDYLKWFGFTSADGPEAHINTNLLKATKSRLADPNPDDNLYDDIFGDQALTEAQKKQKVQDYTYMALTPTAEGVDYRNQLLVSGKEKYYATEYNKICYGDEIASQSIGTDGMLKMIPYSENFLTKWLIANWNRVLVITVFASIVVLFLVMALKGKKLTWFIATLLSTVLMLVILPSSGEITPYVCDKVVQSMFQKGAQYWSINEGIESAYLEAQAAETDTSAEALTYIKAFSLSNTSRSLMLKRDISKKVLTTKKTDTQQLLRLSSTRWILGSLIRQVSADNVGDMFNYVYVTLNDMRGSLQDLFVLYDTGNLNAKYYRAYIEDNGLAWFQDLCSGLSASGLDDEFKKYYDGYQSITFNDPSINSRKYRSFTHSDVMKKSSTHLKFGYLARLYHPAESYNVLTVQSMADDNGHITTASIDKFQENVVEAAYNPMGGGAFGFTSQWRDAAEDIVSKRLSKLETSGATQEFGFLHLTEDIIPYFYLVVKDTYSYEYDINNYEDVNAAAAGGKNDNLGLGQLMTNLLGSASPMPDGTTVRYGVPFSTIDGKSYVKDILDLEYLFTNYVPYMASVMFTAGGADGASGMLHDVTMEQIGFDLYGDSEAAWLFRSNWVIKLITSNNYSAPARITDRDGNEYTVEHQLFPQNYPADKGRPMVFSEAQMIALGLTEGQLTRVELACVNTNRKAVQQWQMLVNYANTDGITREIIEEQMALEAAMIFNKEFVDDNFISNEMALYPTSFDLRCINFDAVLKLLVISDNYNNASLSQDAIYTIMADKGIWGGRLALWTAFLCQTAVPFMRNLTLGFLFYLALASCLFNLVNDNRSKAKASIGGITCNTIYALWTIAYYCIFWMLITRAGGDLILTRDGFNTGTSNIIWKLILVLAASLIYIVVSVAYIIRVVIRDIPGMGMSVLQQYWHSAYVKVKSFADKIGAKFGSKSAAENSRESAAKDVAEVRDDVEKANGGGGAEKVDVTDSAVTIKNDKKNPIPVFDTNSANDPTYIEDDSDNDSGFVEDENDTETTVETDDND